MPKPDPTTDERVKKQLEGFGKSVASFREYIEKENRKKEEKERRKQEKMERQHREEMERQAREEARLAKERRIAKKQAKIKKAEEEKMELSKAMRMQLAVCVGGLREQMQEEMRRNMEAFNAIIKGKQAAASPTSTPPGSPVSYTSKLEASEVEEISQKAKDLTIGDKRKRSPDATIGNSPPMEVPPKRTPRNTKVKPRKLAAKLLTTASKKTTKKGKPEEGGSKTPKRYTPKRGTPKTNIAAKIGSAGKTKFVVDNMRQLAEYQADDLKLLCRREDLVYGNKVLAVINVAEKLAEEAYGEEGTSADAEAEVGIQEASDSTTEGEEED
ncbi:hypothetical protein CBR_g37971 [Chara braunii]|uniref:Uncharacterized protein n=1 Tax=Chara braunii TaxID=69332 RepID=A0A388LP19_CHABU|nr:hypothetical protein CBR_g37971 [Chara braunii]|eukprot:GBG84096.1 hypothetical protein CBR_g37971 [Chara braunii]